MKKIIIQPRNTPEGVKPHPYLIHEDGKVGEQKHWKGSPFELVGFAEKPVPGEMKINLGDFFFHPAQAIRLYPVFKTKKGKWFTSKDAVDRFEVIKYDKN